MVPSLFCCSLILIFLVSNLNTVRATNYSLSSYIVLTDHHSRPSEFLTQGDRYAFMIRSSTISTESQNTGSRMFYHYNVGLTCFAARLTIQEAELIAKILGLTNVFEDTAAYTLHTTRSPRFLGLDANYGLWPETNFDQNVIVGIIDTGIWPESESFSDRGIGPAPSRWNGSWYTHFKSNNLNEDFDGDYQSPRDGTGHGTHVASIAVGTPVGKASLFGFAEGTARGIATKARLAVYKVCHWGMCVGSDVLAAIEASIVDGVDILSISIGIEDTPPYMDVISRGAFAAMEHNIFVACSARNLGPAPYTVWNTAPWITTVGAGSIDRSFPAKVLLGNGIYYIGSSMYTASNGMSQSFPLLYLGTCESIDAFKQNLTGNIVICFGLEENAYNNGIMVHEAGGVGLIQANKKNKGEGLMAVAFPLPGALVGFKDGEAILAYIRTSNSPTARFFFYNHTVTGKDRAPILAAISSRGQNPTVLKILKPDLIAPGFNILGAYVPTASPSLSPYDSRRVNFTILSGISMACPHVVGAAVLLHAAHPKWSPAAIKSALMTTAGVMDNQDHQISQYEDMEPATALGIGAGHINPQLAADPGLIYDASPSEYISFLCSLKYTKEQIKQLVKALNPCSGPVCSHGDLNYPSFFVVFKPKDQIQELKRTLTNVGELLPEVYRVRIGNSRIDKINITVEPKRLTFNYLHEGLSYTVRFESRFIPDNSSEIIGDMVIGSIAWVSKTHIVRSPIAIMWHYTKK